jgi:hypothetical protein
LSQIAGWSAAAAVFKANLGLDLSGSEFYDVRTAYLVFFVIGTALSIVILVLGLFDYLPPKLAVYFYN